jgi:hypothetical protein
MAEAFGIPRGLHKTLYLLHFATHDTRPEVATAPPFAGMTEASAEGAGRTLRVRALK